MTLRRSRPPAAPLGLCLIALGLCAPAQAAELLVEAESFADKGGWVLDAQFVDAMGSPYLLAHGQGSPCADAAASVVLPAAGVWRLWVRTRDWTPDFAGEKPGRFQVSVNGITLPATFGVTPASWGWADGGTVALADPAVEIRLKDLTGFDGRCDALFFTDDLSAAPPPDGGDALRAWRAQRLGETETPASTSAHDLVVVGGGLAGTCAAIAAAERGLTVALVQDRPVLGGNGSAEIRVRTEGEKRHRIVSAVANDAVNASSNAVAFDLRRMAEVAKYPNISLLTGWRAYGVATNAARQLTAVDARQTDTGERRRFTAPLFVDATGDAWLGFWAGAAYRMGREAAAEHGESRAPATGDAMTMGNSLMWTSRDTGQPAAFPAVPWALPVAGSAAETGGGWNWEYGMHLDTIYDAEAIRDHLLRAIYGTFYNAKQKSANTNLALDWVPYVAGKRESRRLRGDYLLTQSDIVNGVYFEDAVGTATWSIDLHYPTAVSYRSTFTPTDVATWYFPYRCLYSRDIPNLFMAGRNISVTHVALGSPRVMNTCGQMGVAVGYAASLCKAYGCLPRDIYRSAAKTAELQLLIGGVWPQRVAVEPEPPEVAVLVDNTNVPPSDICGVWTGSVSAAGQFEGTNYLHDGNAGKGPDKWIRFTPELPEEAVYEVRQKWSAGDNRATNACVEIVHAAGTHTVSVNMRKNGGVWNTLGTWRFAAGTAGGARLLTSDADGGYVMADAFLFVKCNHVTVDNPEAERSGEWVGSTSMTGQFFGTNYLHNATQASDSLWVRYRPDLPAAGTYRLQQIWNGSSGRATAVKIAVTYADGTATNTVDMSRNGGVWNTLGTWRFAAGTAGSARILTTGTAGSTVIADAFRWTRTDDVIVDNADPSGVTRSGTWTASSYEPGRYGSNYLHNAKLSSPTNWLRFTPELRAPGDYEVRLIWNGSDRATNATVEVTHADGVSLVAVNMRANGGVWNTLGVWRFEAGTAGSVRLLTEGTGAQTVIADAVWFAPYVPPAPSGDWDANGLPDDWERFYFLNAGGVDPDGDADRDGLCNFGEYLAGTDPVDSASTFSIRNMLEQPAAPESMLLTWPSAEGRLYDILSAETLGGPFSALVSGLAATPPQNSYAVPKNGASRFYRIVVRPAE